MTGTYVPSFGPVHTLLLAHLYPGMPVRVSLHPKEDRVVVGIGASAGAAGLDLFVQRAELVALRDALAAAVTDLVTAQQALQPDTTDEPGKTAPAVEVRTPAA